jgi:aminoglycoside phosphotransferase (APT) family kinase protein
MPDAQVTGLRRLAGGTGHETWAFDLCEDTGQPTHSLVLRRNFEHGMLDGDPRIEFELLTALERAGIPVPRPWWCVTENSPLEQPFMIVERLPGTDIRKHLAAHPETDRAELGRRLVGLQARLHHLDWPTHLPSLADPKPDAWAELDRWSSSIEKATDDPGPLLVTALGWLHAHPSCPEHRCLVHADFKTNNLIFGADGAITVLDWELAHLGDPIEDLAWTMLWTTRFDLVGGLLTAEEYVAAYEAESGRSVDPAALRYWRLFALVKLAAIFLTGLSRGVTPTLLLMGRALHHIEAELGMLLPTMLRAESTP